MRRVVHAEQILRDCDVDCEDLWRRGQGLSSSTCELSHERASSAPQPQTDCDPATSVMLSWPLPQQSAARTPQRLRRHRVPLPQQEAGMTPQRLGKTILRKLHPSECTEPANSYTVHDPSRCSGPVGETRKRRLAEEVEGPDPQYCRPGGPAIANRLDEVKEKLKETCHTI